MRILAVTAALTAILAAGNAEARPASSGPYAEFGIGGTSFIGDQSDNAALGLAGTIHVGLDIFSWFSIGGRVGLSSHEATVPPPPEGEYFQPGEDVSRPGDQTDEDGGSGAILTGTSACGGQVEGRAAVLRDLSESAKVSHGDVLVTRQTDPGWAPVFFLIKGLVLERGGMLSHGAIIAREYGIPAVVGVAKATEGIASGQQVRVNADQGNVEIL